jgi:DNA invertase Pin-like site-specific DNA recombinase
VRMLKAQGVGPTAIAKQLGIGRASVYRILDH